MAAGKLDRRIAIERATVTKDALGGDVETWAPLTTVWAMRKDLSDRETMTSDQLNASLTSRFTVRSSVLMRSVTAKDRLNYDGDLWNILPPKETRDDRGRFLEITATRQRKPNDGS